MSKNETAAPASYEAMVAATGASGGADLLLAMLGKIPGLNEKPIEGDEVEFHDSPKISLPRNMTYKRAYGVLERLEKEAEETTGFTRMFRYRPDDGAYAAFQVIKARWGMGLGKAIDMGFFGKRPPEMRTIAIGVNETMQVPWGLVSIPTLPGLEIYIGEAQDNDYGRIFGIRGEGPRKYKDEMEGFFDDVADYLQENSIYRGRAIIGSNDPQFLDLSSFDPNQIVFADDVVTSLEGTLWTPIRYTEAMRREGVPLKRAVLLHGPYGTGKTSIGQLTALIATENEWTFISARPGRDKIEDVLRTARLYQPAVVFVEDIDNATSSSDDGEVTKLLEAFDGITAKGGELMIAMTTNHIERIHKGMLRPGRLDAVIHIESLDRNGVERLCRAVIDTAKLEENVDFDAVYKAMSGFYPAFVREAINRAVTFALGRLGGKRDYTIGTADLVGAANSLHEQLAALEDANEGERSPSFDQVFRDSVINAVTSTKVYDGYNGDWRLIKTQAQIDNKDED